MGVSIVLAGVSVAPFLACLLLLALLDPGAVARVRERRHWRWQISKRDRVG